MIAGGLSSLVVVVLSSGMLVGGQNCSLTTGQGVSFSYYLYLMYKYVCSCFIFTGIYIHAVTEFHFSTVTVSAESVGGSTPGARVTWNTTVPPECVAAVRVEFRTSSHILAPVVATYNTTNTSQTEVIQTGLQCITYYYVRVIITGDIRTPGGIPVTPMLSPAHSDVQVLVGGKETAWMFACDFNLSNLMVVMPLHRSTYPSCGES